MVKGNDRNSRAVNSAVDGRNRQKSCIEDVFIIGSTEKQVRFSGEFEKGEQKRMESSLWNIAAYNEHVNVGI